MKTFFNALSLILLPFLIFGQQVKNADFISSLEDGYAAVKIQNQWSFIDENGKLIFDLRNDLVFNEQVTTAIDIGVATMTYPLMIEERAIVKKVKDGIAYYGFIDITGNIVIEPDFLNVSNFKDGYAVALKLSEEVLGENRPLGKRVVNYHYDLVLIDRDGQIVKYLCGPFHIVLAKERLKEAPPIVAKDIGTHLLAVKTPTGKWEVIYID
jgi:hypothetical protein